MENNNLIENEGLVAAADDFTMSFGKTMPIGNSHHIIVDKLKPMLTSSGVLMGLVEGLLVVVGFGGLAFSSGSGWRQGTLNVYMLFQGLFGLSTVLPSKLSDSDVFMVYQGYLTLWIRFILTPFGRGVWLLHQSWLCLGSVSDNICMFITGVLAAVVAILHFVLHFGYQKELDSAGLNLTINQQNEVYVRPDYIPMPEVSETMERSLSRLRRDENKYVEKKELPRMPTLEGAFMDPYTAKYHDAKLEDEYQKRFS